MPFIFNTEEEFSELLFGGGGLTPEGAQGQYEAEAFALFNRFSTPPTDARKTLINNLIKTLKAGGIWTKLDALWLIAAADAQAGQRNWIGDVYNLALVNAPTFTADRGYAGNGTTSYLNTGISLAGGGLKASQNANGGGVWVNTNTGLTHTDMGGSDWSIGANRIAGNASFRNANGTSQTVAAPDASDVGLWQSSRQASGSYSTMKNGVVLSTPATVSGTFASPAMYLCCRSDGTSAPVVFSTRRMAAAYFGNLTVADNLAIYNAFNTYLTAIGGT